MNLETRVPLKVHDEPHRPMLEIINAEKQLWSLIYSKGVLHKEAQELYVKICSMYEKIILNDYEAVEFQEFEYSLWKLHYKHIHEFRKRISQSSMHTGCTESKIDSHVEKYKSFLTEATEFYQNLISKVRKYYGFEEISGVIPSDPVKWHKCQCSCHRFLVCLGDLARYKELCKNLDVQQHNWSVSANYYFKAVSSWSDSGNPQNQLAVLAKYISDDFLALYHCIRSLAVKEPFPDARNNLILLLEENRSTDLESLSREAHFNFSNPLERSASPSAFDITNNEMQYTDRTSSTKNGLWSLFVRMISLFFVESSSVEFSYTFASTMNELEMLLGLSDIELSGSLESYQHMNPDRTGPYRALQLVSILILTVDSLTITSDNKEAKENIDLKQQPNLLKSAFSATFSILGRVIERCLNSNVVKSNPLLPAVLVFVEWLIGMLDIVQEYVFEEEVAYAVSYFLDTFVELLNQFETRGKVKNQTDIALWEDFELRGFVPVACSHKLLNFFSHKESTSEFVGGDARVHRIFEAAIKIVEKSPTGFRKWIFYDTEREKFFTYKQPSSVNLESKEPQQTLSEVIKDKELISKIIAIEDEEEIIFKPLQRYNSAPVYSSELESSTASVNEKTVLSDDSLRRATSFSPPYPSGPPSLNAWVFDKESIKSIDGVKENTAIDFFKPRLSTIDEMSSLSLIDSPPYSAPIPSAPLLPADAILLFENSTIHDMNSPMSDTSIYTNRSVFYEPSKFTPMSSSEWLRQFRNHNINRGNHLVQPIHLQTPAISYANEASSRLHFINRWELNPSNPNQIMHPEIPRLYAGSELGVLADELRRKNLIEIPTLQYVKEKEWQLLNQAQGRGFAYMGN